MAVLLHWEASQDVLEGATSAHPPAVDRAWCCGISDVAGAGRGSRPPLDAKLQD